MPRPKLLTEIHGRRFGLGGKGELISNIGNNGQGENQWSPTYGVTRVSLTAVQVRAGFSAPTTILAAPGAGFVLLVDRVHYNLPAGTAFGGIAAGEDILIVYTAGTIPLVVNQESTGFLDSTAAETRISRWSDVALGHDLTASANLGVDFELLVGDITLGRPLLLDIYYERIDLAAFVL